MNRDPDQYEFHVMTLPSSLIDPPHSSQSRELVLDSVEHGRLVQGKSEKEMCSNNDSAYI